MATPLSVRLGKAQNKLTKISGRTGLKTPDILKLSLEELFEKYPTDALLKEAVIRYRIENAKKEAK